MLLIKTFAKLRKCARAAGRRREKSSCLTESEQEFQECSQGQEQASASVERLQNPLLSPGLLLQLTTLAPLTMGAEPCHSGPSLAAYIHACQGESEVG